MVKVWIYEESWRRSSEGSERGFNGNGEEIVATQEIEGEC